MTTRRELGDVAGISSAIRELGEKKRKAEEEEEKALQRRRQMEHYVMEIAFVTNQYLEGVITAEEMANKVVLVMTTYNLLKPTSDDQTGG